MKPVKKLHLLLLGAALSLTGVATAQTTIIKFSHVAASDTPKGKAALRFKELVEQASHHRVRVDVYPNNILHRESDELEALQLGAVQMLAPSLAKLALFGFKEFEVFDLPYVFSDREAVARVTQGSVGKSLLKKLETKGMVGLGYWDGGFKIMSSNKPLKMPADFKGMRMRIHSSRVLDAQMDALGAVAQSMEASEVYAALQNRIVDGAETLPVNFNARKWYELQSNVTLSNHGYVGYAVIVNKKFWDDLPTDLRKVIEGAMTDSTSYGNALAAQENDAALAWLKKSRKVTVHTLSASESAAWRQALQPVSSELEGRIGKAVVLATTREADGRWPTRR
jgi:C4-dicarboxylate-binding protein DctP